MKMFSCAVEGCKNTVEFIFPSNLERKEKWLEAIRRTTYIPKKRHGLCSFHFKSEHFIYESRDGGFKNSRRILRKDAVPCVFAWNTPDLQWKQSNYEMKPLISEHLPIIEFDIPIKVEDPSQDTAHEHVDVDAMTNLQKPDHSKRWKDEITVKEEPLWDYNQDGEAKHTISTSTQTSRPLNAFMTIEHFRDRPDAVSYYTGLGSYAKFMTMLNSLRKEVHTLQYEDVKVLDVNVADQLFITLWKLKRNCTDFELSINFAVSEKTISSIIRTWITHMSQRWSEMDTWPSRKLVRYYMPPNFRSDCPSDRHIVDGTEIRQPQQCAFATYKNKKRLKSLIGATIDGLVPYCSSAYSGDCQLTRHSLLVDRCDLEDSMKVDSGFNLRDIFVPKNAGTNVPTMLKGISSLSAARTVSGDRELARHRVHVERVMGLAKTYEILNSTLSHHYMPLASDIFSVIIMLCNFRDGIR